jgi:large subunit ribosomal protein L6
MSTEQQISKKNQAAELTVELPSGVTSSFSDGILLVTGPLGKVSQDFSKVPVALKIQGSAINVSTTGSRRRDKAIINTAKSMITNAIEGVVSGYEYKLKLIFAHFPVTVKVQGKRVLVENFYGERSPRVGEIVGDSKVEVQGEDITVTGVSIRDVGQTAANLEQATKVKRKDQRVFLDGVYIYERIRKGKQQNGSTS